MASNTIKGLTVEIGGDTTKLGKALEDVNKQSRQLSSELGQINKLLKMDPGNADLLAQKQKVLADAVNNTAKKLELLEEAERQVQEQFKRGEVSEEQVRALQREIIDTTQKLDKYKQAAKETADAVDALGDESKEAAGEIDKAGDNAKKTEKEAEDLGSSLDGTLSTGFKAVAAVAAAASAAIIGCVEASHEYRREMGKLDTAFTTAGHSSETAKNTYKELQGVLGETDQAVEAANMLAKLADDEQELNQLTGALTGVYATFGASLPIEGLAEAALETRNVAKVTGPFADAINWANEAGTDWNMILGDNNEALKAFKKAVEDGEAVEDAYTAALEACSDEQERQELITGTLTKLYGKAGDQYKKTNKQVIEANKANEEWNETMADVGEEMAPVVTEVKKFGTELVKNAKEPLKDVAGFLVDKVLPALSNLGGWVRNNTPTIKAGIAGVTAALVAYKVATIATEVAHKGLKGAIMATAAAEKALQLVQAATPWGLAAVAIGTVVTALAVYAKSTEETAQDVNVLTEEERELMAAADEAAQSFRDQKEAYAETASGITSQMGHVQSLAQELQTLADASGKVKEKDEARAQFILNELNEALGTEYTMTDGVVQKYDELKKNIDAVIQSKTANALLEANNALYVEAIQNEAQALADLNLAEKDYQAQKEVSEQKIREWDEELAELRQKQIDGVGILTQSESMALQSQINNLARKVNEEKQLVSEKETRYNESLNTFAGYYNTIQNYQDAEEAALQGNYDKAVELLKGKGSSFGNYSGEVSQATKDTVNALYKEAVDMGLAAEKSKYNFENGIEGYTEESVKESEEAYQAALDAWAEAYDSANAIGTDLGGGLKAGMEGTRLGLVDKAKSLVKSIFAAMRNEADSHSPSRKAIAIFEDIGEGGVIGMENETPDLLKTARKQVQGLMTTYQNASEDEGPNAIRGVAERASARTAENFQSFMNGNNSKLDKILAAIKAGQVLLLDGDRLVGGTSERMDGTLGQRRVLIERGAL